MSSQATDGDRSKERSAPRFPRPAHAFYSLGDSEGRGALQDLSLRGARIERATPLPEKGTEVELTFQVHGDLFPVQIAGVVVRHTATGFAVQFGDLDAEVRRLLELVVSDLEDRDEDEEDDTEPEVSS